MHSRIRPWVGSILSCLSFSLLAAEAPKPPATASTAEEEELLLLLNTPISGASKREQRLLDSPQAIEVLTGEELRQQGVYRLQDALKLMTSVDLLEGDQGGSVVGMRGVMQEGQPRTVQILVDGVPMYCPVGGPIDVSNLPVPLELIDKVEVVRGPSSTLYGANAVCGVIAITTKRATEGLSGGARLSGASLGTRRGGASLLLGRGDWSLVAGYDGFSTGTSGFATHFLGRPDQIRLYQEGPQTSYSANPFAGPDAAHGWQGMARAQYQHRDTTLWLEGGRSGKTYGGEGYFTYREDTRTMGLAGWRQAWTATFATEVRLHRLDQANNLSPVPYLVVGLVDPGFKAEYPFVSSHVTKVEVQANWTLTPGAFLVLGADHAQIRADRALFIGIRNDATEAASGAFAALDWRIVPQVALSLGLRAENETLGGSRTSPRVAVVWNPTGSTAVRAGYYTSTRSPQIEEARVDFSFFNGTFHDGTATPTTNGAPPNIPIYFSILPNPDLKPEKTTNLEFGIRQGVGACTFDLTLFRMAITGVISQVNLPEGLKDGRIMPPFDPITYPALWNVPTWFVNAGNATDQGLELAATWAVAKGWTAGCNGTWLRYTRDSVPAGEPMGDRFAYAVGRKQNLWLRFHAGRFTGAAAVQAVGATTAEALSANSRPYFEARPAFTQWHLNLGWEFARGLEAAVYVRNGARAFTLQGATGPERPTDYQAMRRELGCTLSYRY
jgi:outer membrane receptor for ferrienterochelin and colicin